MSDRTHVPATLPPATRDLPPHPGVTLVEGGADFSVYAGHADSVDLCLFDGEGTERRVPLSERAHGWWFAFLPDIGIGQRYGLRATGPWDPGQGLRYNEHKLLLDPYAKGIEGQITWGPEVYGHVVDDQWHGDDEIKSALDSAAVMPRCVVLDDRFDWGADHSPRHALSDTVVYAVHVKNATVAHPGVPEELRGTYAGLAHPAMVGHLRDLGVTAVELLPVHAFTSEPELIQRGMHNHWGYNTMGFFAPHAAYARSPDPQGVLDEFKGMV
ncbi:MAG: glycogen debranching enzyme GlgX, partial [Nostocoides sp.]